MVREHTTEHTEIMDRIVTHIGLPSIPDWRRRGGAGSSPPNPGTRDPPGRARARRVYHPPSIRPLRGARWLLTTLLTGFPTTERANAVSGPRGAAAWTAAIRARPRRGSAAGRASVACWPIGATRRSGGRT